MGKDDDLLGALAAVFLGVVGIAIISSIFGPKCPKCGKRVDRGTKTCPHCGAVLEW